jgi:hypothetical protein
MAYATVAELVAYAGIDRDRDNALLTSLIARAQATIEREVRFAFEAAADTTRNLDAASIRDGGNVDGLTLYFPTWCASITSITNGDGVAVASTDYVKLPRQAPYYGVRLKHSKALRWEPDSNHDTEDAIAIVGKWAYSTSAPADIVHATLRLALWFYRQRDNSTDMDRPLLAEGVTLLPSAVPRDVLDILESYTWHGGAP